MLLKKVGFFEGYNKSAIAKGIKINCSSEYPVEKVLNYLKSGIELCSWLEHVDSMFGGTSQNLGAIEYTDGEWVWSSELIYYVEQHSISLPPAFLSYLESKGYIFSSGPLIEEVRFLKGNPSRIEAQVKYDDDMWLEWLSSICPDFDSAESTEYASTKDQKTEAKSKGFELPDDW